MVEALFFIFRLYVFTETESYWLSNYKAIYILAKGGSYMKHLITKYTENGKRFAESWLQINVFGKCFCFSKKKIEI